MLIEYDDLIFSFTTGKFCFAICFTFSDAAECNGDKNHPFNEIVQRKLNTFPIFLNSFLIYVYRTLAGLGKLGGIFSKNKQPNQTTVGLSRIFQGHYNVIVNFPSV